MDNANLIEKNNVPSNISRIVPKFPPEITAKNLIEKAILKLETSGHTSRVPNAFIAYRMAFCKELRLTNNQILSQTQLSSFVKEAWGKEPQYVRSEYQRIAAEARDLYKQTIQSHIKPRLAEKKLAEERTPHKNDSNMSQNLYEVDLTRFVDVKSNDLTPFDPNVSNNTLGNLEALDSHSLSSAAEIELVPNFLSYENTNNVAFIESYPSQLITDSLINSGDVYDFSQNSNQKDCNAINHEHCDCECCKDKIMKLENKVNDLEGKVSFLMEFIGLKLTQNQNNLPSI
ncbi:5949_t:CDS:2 [Ambispora leptoticha]|uniref:5949_t:CDS:1 n=1 Tax=Ambispora leptoticha TaxID=144679 RepID=A0A9N9AUT4_9GLOM|nr:5949_t:CDS:2 [Ambispora leptoticha]